MKGFFIDFKLLNFVFLNFYIFQMIKFPLYFIVFLFLHTLYAQETPNFTEIDSLYREDQFYVGITYNILTNRPIGVAQNSFSSGVHLGILRDFPINKNRTVAIASGIGFSINNYKHNLITQKNNNTINYSIPNANINLDKNNLALYFVDMPLEIRWRNSTPESHIFWRIYTGIKLSYLVLNNSKSITQNQTYKVSNNPDFNKFQYGAYIAAGRNTWNFYGYYGFQDVYKKGTLNGQSIKMNTINLGLMFYIL